MPQIPHKKYISFGASTILVRLLTVALLVGQGPSYLSYPQFHLSYPLSYPLHKAQARAKIAQKRPQMAEDWPQIAQDRPKMFQDRSKTGPRKVPDSSKSSTGWFLEGHRDSFLVSKYQKTPDHPKAVQSI